MRASSRLCTEAFRRSEVCRDDAVLFPLPPSVTPFHGELTAHLPPANAGGSALSRRLVRRIVCTGSIGRRRRSKKLCRNNTVAGSRSRTQPGRSCSMPCRGCNREGRRRGRDGPCDQRSRDHFRGWRTRSQWCRGRAAWCGGSFVRRNRHLRARSTTAGASCEGDYSAPRSV